MLNILLVGLGGFLGSAGRYGLDAFVTRLLAHHWFPAGTLVVNVAGCFLLGVLYSLLEVRHIANPELRLFLFVGLLGGFTTFSTFAHETVFLAREQLWYSALNIGLQLGLGVLALLLGIFLVTSLVNA